MTAFSPLFELVTAYPQTTITTAAVSARMRPNVFISCILQAFVDDEPRFGCVALGDTRLVQGKQGATGSMQTTARGLVWYLSDWRRDRS